MHDPDGPRRPGLIGAILRGIGQDIARGAVLLVIVALATGLGLWIGFGFELLPSLATGLVLVVGLILVGWISG